MILSNREIQTAMDTGRLIIDPEPLPRAPSYVGESCPYSTSSVDLTLGDEISYFRESLAINIDLRKGQFRDLFGPNSVTHCITKQQPYSLEPGKLVLGKTRQIVSFPMTESETCLAGRIEGKSSYARCGLLVHFTAPTVHAGFAGPITLELINQGPLPILLYPDAPICQLIVEEVKGRPFINPSRFQNQSTTGGA